MEEYERQHQIVSDLYSKLNFLEFMARNIDRNYNYIIFKFKNSIYGIEIDIKFDFKLDKWKAVIFYGTFKNNPSGILYRIAVPEVKDIQDLFRVLDKDIIKEMLYCLHLFPNEGFYLGELRI